MMRKALFCCACLAQLLPGQALQAQEAKQTEQAGQSRLPYEVVVTPNESISGLRRSSVRIENDFFEKFNELNLDNDYDVICYKYKPTGSNISRRACEPSFYITVRAANAGDILFDLVGRRPPPALLTAGDIKFDTAREFEVLQQKLTEFYNSDQELLAIGDALADIKRRIDDRKNNE